MTGSPSPPSPQSTVACGWSENMTQEFLQPQTALTIFLKDGYSFFRAHAETLTRRFADPAKTTQILIAHPDNPHMAAIAAMDDKKAGFPESQRSDCLQAVQVLQEIRQALIARGQGDCAPRTAFVGHQNVPTWNGFIGDNTAIMNLYPTRPYRGKLLSLKGEKNGGADNGLLYTAADEDCNALLKQAAPKDNLWAYQLPAHLPDLRR